MNMYRGTHIDLCLGQNMHTGAVPPAYAHTCRCTAWEYRSSCMSIFISFWFIATCACAEGTVPACMFRPRVPIQPYTQSLRVPIQVYAHVYECASVHVRTHACTCVSSFSPPSCDGATFYTSADTAYPCPDLLPSDRHTGICACCATRFYAW
jgi:hypothetical protein